MARTFNGTTDYLEQLIAPVSANPMTYAIWFNRAALVGNSRIIAVNRVGLRGGNICYVNAAGSIFAYSNTSGGIAAQASQSSYTAASWFHVTCVYDNDANRVVYLNGVAGAPDSANIPIPALDVFNIGTCYNPTLADFFDGMLAEAAVWDIRLLQADIDILQKFSPRHVRPQNLKAYVPLIRDLQNLNSGIMTATGTTPSNHPRIFY